MNYCIKRTGVLGFAAGLIILGTLIVAVGQTDGNIKLLRPTDAQSDTAEKPYTSPELVQQLNQLRDNPSFVDSIIASLRRRGIGFPLTDGLRSLAATRSGNNVDLRRTLEEAERRRANPIEHSLPDKAEADTLLVKAKNIIQAFAGAMPDFLVKQLITRSYSPPNVSNFQVYDHLTVGVSYRAEQGEQYKLLSVNGAPPPQDSNFSSVGNATSTGEFVSSLASLFADKSHTVWKAIDTDTLRNRRAIVYEYTVLKQDSSMRIEIKLGSAPERATFTGMRGRLWIDRDTYRVLRAEFISTEIPDDFPAKGSYRLIDYDWVTINDNKYMLPTEADVRLEFRIPDPGYPGQSRNEIRFRNYQKFSTDVKILDDDNSVDDESDPPKDGANPPASSPVNPAETPASTPAKPADPQPATIKPPTDR